MTSSVYDTTTSHGRSQLNKESSYQPRLITSLSIHFVFNMEMKSLLLQNIKLHIQFFKFIILL